MQGLGCMCFKCVSTFSVLSTDLENDARLELHLICGVRHPQTDCCFETYAGGLRISVASCTCCPAVINLCGEASSNRFLFRNIRMYIACFRVVVHSLPGGQSLLGSTLAVACLFTGLTPALACIESTGLHACSSSLVYWAPRLQ